MSFSRRGIIAAGLAIASVGAIGISSNLNAGAATVTTPDTATATTADPTADASTPADTAATALPSPPPGLPGGRATSRRSSQTDPAAVDGATLRPLALTPRRGPKGRPDRVAPPVTRATTTATGAAAAKVPAPPGTDVSGGTVKYHYSSAYQEAVGTGTWAYATVDKPTLVGADYHSLAEVAVRSADRKQTVEVGWSVDPGSFGDTKPRLFVFSWVDGVPKCYNGCGFVQYSSRIKPGAIVPENTTKVFDIQFFGDGWWIGYDSEWIGYFPTALWGGRFTRTGLVQWFGEVAAVPGTPCSEMGNGIAAADDRAAEFDRFGFYGMPAAPTAIRVESPGVSVSSNYYYYPARLVTDNNKSQSVYFGGPGGCSAN